MKNSAPERADALNHGCFCFRVNRNDLEQAFAAALGRPDLLELVRERCPFLFAAQPVFVGRSQLERIGQLIEAIESVVALPAYREQVLASAPDTARTDTAGTRATRGVFFGYDFHLEHDKLSLIEINTNAGGAMLNALLARAQRATCAALGPMVPTPEDAAAFERNIISMFRREWQLAGPALASPRRALATIAIVDTAPESQYLYPEFVLFKRLFEQNGLNAVIADPASLEWRSGRLWHDDVAIDLVYNRLTDFYLVDPDHAALREAFVQQGIVLTPNPRLHALYADKRRLALLSDPAQLQALDVPLETREILLTHVPRTEVVNSADAQRLWDARRGLFFKPTAGFGSRAAYRGDKLTRRVWQEILAGDYVAQTIAAPGERAIGAGGETRAMKFDLRAFAYDGEVQWTAARLYQGQTTNFRTPGGGFSPVYSAAADSGPSCTVLENEGGDCDADDAGAYASYVFLLDDSGGIHPLPHTLYVALARGDASAPTLVGQTLRLIDWYVRLKDGAPHSVVNETCNVVAFDAKGWMRPATTLPMLRARSDATTETRPEPGSLSTSEREQLQDLLFEKPTSLRTDDDGR